MIFSTQDQKRAGAVSSGVHTVVHYFRESCQCCRDLEAVLTIRAQDNSSIRYVPVYLDDGELPRYEIYGPDRKLLNSDRSALVWIERNLKPGL